MGTYELATISLAGTALVLAPINTQPIRDLNTPLPELEPVAEPAVVANYDNHGSLWGYDTITDAEAMIARHQADGGAVDEWNVIALDGQPLRVVRIADPTFLDTICVIPEPHADAPAAQVLETVPANGGLLGYDRYAITPGAPLPGGQVIAAVEDSLGSAWRVTDFGGGVHWLHKRGELCRYTSGTVVFTVPDWVYDLR